ncbi:MAG: hypothetical protein ACI865_001332 [Flavobacteriaceae bacterium]|jgi:hypothetical protein
MIFHIRFIIAGALIASAVNVNSQTAEEKIALAFCECSDEKVYQNYVDLLNSGDIELIRSMVDSMQALFFTTKRCAKKKAMLSEEEHNGRISEDGIGEALIKHCPNVEFVHREYRRISWEVEREERDRDIEERLSNVERYIEAAQNDSARLELEQFTDWYGTDFSVDRIIKFYYQLGDYTTANNIVKPLIEELNEDWEISESYEKEKAANRAFLKDEFLTLAKKHAQTEIISRITEME